MTTITAATFSSALALIEAYGKDVTFRTSTKTTNASLANVETDVVTDTQKAYGYDVEAKFVDGDIVRIGDQWLLVNPIGLTVTPVVGMQATIAGAAYRAMQVITHELAGAAVLYQIRVRK